jgi:hypothetical protein
MCKVNTGLTTFDSQIKSLVIGDFSSETQYSIPIEKNTFSRLINTFDLSLDQIKIVKDFLDENNEGVLYQFFFRKRGESETIGFILTNKKRDKSCTFGARTKKRKDALESILKIITSK